jgi:hypothetical protein
MAQVGAALVQFWSPLFCRNDCLERGYSCQIGPFSGKLLLPCLPYPAPDLGKFTGGRLVAPVGASRFDNALASIKWGETSSVSPPAICSMVRTALFELDSELDESDPRAVSYDPNCDRWLQIVDDHSAYATRSLAMHGVDPENLSGQFMLFLFDSSKLVVKNDPHELRFRVSMAFPDRAMGFSQFSDILSQASGGKDLLPEESMLLSAYRAFRQGDFRKSFVESAVSVELSLGRRMTAAASSLQLRIPSPTLTLGQKLRGLASLKMVHPTGFNEKLFVDLRNKVAHYNFLPSETEARYFVETSETLLTHNW